MGVKCAYLRFLMYKNILIRNLLKRLIYQEINFKGFSKMNDKKWEIFVVQLKGLIG